jgi:hypothetical protein
MRFYRLISDTYAQKHFAGPVRLTAGMVLGMMDPAFLLDDTHTMCLAEDFMRVADKDRMLSAGYAEDAAASLPLYEVADGVMYALPTLCRTCMEVIPFHTPTCTAKEGE